MAPHARFSIGIDLGTTNSVLAFAALDGSQGSTPFAVPQVASATTLIEASTLPSFLYLPERSNDSGGASEAASEDERWVIGCYARAKASETPGRVVHSAKSWLVQHRTDRTANILPWGSEDVERAAKISPLKASVLLLRYLREAWDSHFTDDSLDAQVVTITVPASFDVVAQQLTLTAAREAGYPVSVRLLEEPQAALYRWLERGLGARAGDEWFARDLASHILVVDIGGGTSDFSVFALTFEAGKSEPQIERIAVSEHLLLGGDNMDLALAQRLESQLSCTDESLSGRQWDALLARSRDLKEAALEDMGGSDDIFTVSIPGRGSQLIAQALSTQLTRAQVECLLFDGFFPACGADEYPIRATTALLELGLPYARDPAITRHLAEFLRDRPPIDGLLCNGGTLRSPRLQERICKLIGAWQNGKLPRILVNVDPDLAVARGAAHFGQLAHARGQRIKAGAAHAIFVQAERAADTAAAPDSAALVCVLPHGAPTQTTYAITELPLELRVRQLVRFATFSSTRRFAQRAGEVFPWNERDFVALPALETSIDCDSGDAIEEPTLPVTLTAGLSELGIVRVACVSRDPRRPGSWPLDFDLRPLERRVDGSKSPAAHTTASRDLQVAVIALTKARLRIETLFAAPFNRRDKLSAARLLTSLEAIVDLPRSHWNVGLVRSLWSTLEGCAPHRNHSVDHAQAWLILAGFFLRPGFGAPGDAARIDRLWVLREAAPAFARKTLRVHDDVLWRRVAGGLSRERQHALFASHVARLHAANPPPELVLLVGALERLDLQLKTELIERFLAAVILLKRDDRHYAHVLAALAALLARAPLYAGPETVVPPHLVVRAFEVLAALDWSGSRALDVHVLFLRAARVVNNRNLDVPRSMRMRIVDKLERSGVSPLRTAPLRDYVALERNERIGNFGESLPPGLILHDGNLSSAQAIQAELASRLHTST